MQYNLLATLASKIMAILYSIEFKARLIKKSFIIRQFLKENPDYVILFSTQSDERLNKYISETDNRIKKISASILLKSFSNSFKVVSSERLTEQELELIKTLIPQIKDELKIV